jgi:hypothetical protein
VNEELHSDFHQVAFEKDSNDDRPGQSYFQVDTWLMVSDLAESGIISTNEKGPTWQLPPQFAHNEPRVFKAHFRSCTCRISIAAGSGILAEHT